MLTTQDTTTNDQDLLLSGKNQQTSSVRSRLQSVDLGPSTRGTEVVVQEDFTQVTAADDDGAEVASNGSPDVVGTAVGDSAVGGDERAANAGVEVCRVGGDAVVDGEICLFGAVEFIGHDVLTERKLGDYGHTRTPVVGTVDDVVDDGAPGVEIGRNLVDHLLTVARVALVRVVVDEGVVVGHEERLPDGSQSVVGKSLTTMGDVGDKLPGVTLVRAGVEFELGLGEVVRNGAASKQDGAGSEVANGLRQLVEEGLVSQSPSVDLIIDTRTFRPSVTAIVRLVDGEVRVRVVVVEVVLPGCENNIVFFAVLVQKNTACIEGSRHCIVSGRCEDGDMVDVASWCAVGVLSNGGSCQCGGAS